MFIFKNWKPFRFSWSSVRPLFLLIRFFRTSPYGSARVRSGPFSGFLTSDRCCMRSKLSRTYVKTSWSFKIKFEIHHTAHALDFDDPELDAFESNLVALIRVRELGKIAALLSNLCPNASDPQSAGVLWHTISLLVKLEQFTRWSWIRNIHKMEVWRALLLRCWPLVRRENLWRRFASSCSLRGAVFTNCPVSVHQMETFHNSEAESDK